MHCDGKVLCDLWIVRESFQVDVMCTFLATHVLSIMSLADTVFARSLPFSPCGVVWCGTRDVVFSILGLLKVLCDDVVLLRHRTLC